METNTLRVSEPTARLIIHEPNAGFIIENPDTNIIQVNKCTTKLNLATSQVRILSIGVQGPPGPVGIDLHFVYVQGLSSSLWTIFHNLHKKPAVTVVDSGDTVVIGSINYIDEDNLQISFSAPFSGRAYLN